MNRNIFLVLLVLSFPFGVSGQVIDKMNIGLGAGMDYGGFGGRVTYNVSPKIGAFGCLGYNLDALGYNLGVQFRDQISKRASLYVNGMYGYNAVLIIDGPQGKVKTTYYGPSIGVGFHKKSKRNENFWSSGIILPFRSEKVFNAIGDLQSVGYTISPLLPLTISIGYHIQLK